jgi:hypothetical protein
MLIFNKIFKNLKIQKSKSKNQKSKIKNLKSNINNLKIKN